MDQLVLSSDVKLGEITDNRISHFSNQALLGSDPEYAGPGRA